MCCIERAKRKADKIPIQFFLLRWIATTFVGGAQTSPAFGQHCDSGA